MVAFSNQDWRSSSQWFTCVLNVLRERECLLRRMRDVHRWEHVWVGVEVVPGDLVVETLLTCRIMTAAPAVARHNASPFSILVMITLTRNTIFLLTSPVSSDHSKHACLHMQEFMGLTHHKVLLCKWQEDYPHAYFYVLARAHGLITSIKKQDQRSIAIRSYFKTD